MILKPGDEPIPGYRLTRFIGKGQFGQVWEALTPGRALIALKFLDLSGKQGRKEFRAIQRMKRVRHAHLMPIIGIWLLDANGSVLDDEAMDEIGEESSSIADTLDISDVRGSGEKPSVLVVGQPLGDKTLGERLEECVAETNTGLPLDELLVYMDETARVLDFLNAPQHDLGDGLSAVRHCDIKPTNILLVGNSVSITDYGLAQVLAGGKGSSKATGMIGSPAYMSPECIAREPSESSDQYSLAVSFVELRTGKLPFQSESFAEVLDAHRSGRLDLSRLSPDEQKVIRRATSVKPSARFPSAQAMVHALRETTRPRGEEAGQSRRRSIVALTLASIGSALAIWVVLTVGGGRGPSLANIEEDLKSAEKALVESADTALVVQIFDSLQTKIDAELQSRHEVPMELQARAALGRARALSRVSQKESDPAIVERLNVVRELAAAAGSDISLLLASESHELSYWALRAIHETFPDNITALARLKERAGAADLDGWITGKLPDWETTQLGDAEKRLYRYASEHEEQLTENPAVDELAMSLWPQIHNFRILGESRAVFAESSSDNDILASLQGLTSHLEGREQWLVSADEAPRQLRGVYEALERRAALGVSADSFLQSLRDFHRALTPIANASTQASPDVRDLQQSVARCGVVIYLYSGDVADLERAVPNLPVTAGDFASHDPLVLAAMLDRLGRLADGMDEETVDPFRRDALSRIENTLDGTSDLPFANYLVVIHAATILAQEDLPDAQHEMALKRLQAIAATGYRYPALTAPELQRVLLRGLQRIAMQRNIDTLYRTDLTADNDDTFTGPDPLPLGRQHCAELFQQWKEEGSEMAHEELQLREADLALSMAESIKETHAAPEINVTRESIAAAQTLIERIATLPERQLADRDSVAAPQLFGDLANPAYQQAVALVKKERSREHQELFGRVAYRRGRILLDWIGALTEDAERGGKSIDEEIYESFRLAFRSDPANVEYLHQHCRAITELNWSPGDVGLAMTSRRLAALNEAIALAKEESVVKIGWQGYVKIMESRVGDCAGRPDRLRDAIRFCDAALPELSTTKEGPASTLNQRQQMVTLLLNRSTARVELGYLLDDHQEQRRLYEGAIADARRAMEEFGASDNPRAYVAWANAAEDLAFYVGEHASYQDALQKFAQALSSSEESRSRFVYPQAAYGWARCNLRMRENAISRATGGERQSILQGVAAGDDRLKSVIESVTASPTDKAEAWTWLARTRTFQAEHGTEVGEQRKARADAYRALEEAIGLFVKQKNVSRSLGLSADALQNHWLAYGPKPTGEQNTQRITIANRLFEHLNRPFEQFTPLCIEDETLYDAVATYVMVSPDTDDNTAREHRRAVLALSQGFVERNPKWKLEHQYLGLAYVEHPFREDADLSAIDGAVAGYEQLVRAAHKFSNTDERAAVLMASITQQSKWLDLAQKKSAAGSAEKLKYLQEIAAKDYEILQQVDQFPTLRTQLIDVARRNKELVYAENFVFSVANLWLVKPEDVTPYAQRFEVEYKRLPQTTRQLVSAAATEIIKTIRP